MKAKAQETEVIRIDIAEPVSEIEVLRAMEKLKGELEQRGVRFPIIRSLVSKEDVMIMTKHFSLMYWYTGLWFRVFGVGISARNITASPQNALTFSERNGYKRYLKVGRWVFRWLSRSPRLRK